MRPLGGLRRFKVGCGKSGTSNWHPCTGLEPALAALNPARRDVILPVVKSHDEAANVRFSYSVFNKRKSLRSLQKMPANIDPLGTRPGLRFPAPNANQRPEIVAEISDRKLGAFAGSKSDVQ